MQVGASSGSLWVGTFEAGWVPCCAGRHRWRFAGAWAPDQFPVAHRVVADGELQDPHEHQSTAPRGAAVGPEHELVQILGQVLAVHCSLMSAQQPPLASVAMRCGPRAATHRDRHSGRPRPAGCGDRGSCRLPAIVKGHEELPTGGQGKCPLMAMKTAHSWPTDLPTRVRRRWPCAVQP